MFLTELSSEGTFSRQQPLIQLKLNTMYPATITGSAEIFGQRHKLVGISRVNQNSKHADDRIFTDVPIQVPGANYKRRSFKRSELKNYQA